MGRTRRQARGPGGVPVLVLPVEFRRGAAEERRIAADLVQGQQPAVDVERRVLQALGHDGRGDLLETEDEVPQEIPHGLLHPRREGDGEDVPEKVV